ncbi:MAG TPA: carboxypeptidase-like regulatory domain-containing protein [Pirellulales bacterium]|nr:carboxypeptidase-like regulatory domain-containing protein [Pirellulales bacterium]
MNYRNTPVDGASVVFSPTSAGPTAVGMTDAQGRYTLSTGEKTGAVPGDYKVTVVKSRIEGPTMTDEERNKYVQEHEGASPPTPVSKNLLPEKYVSTQTSDLSVTVKSGENDIPLNLTD